MEGREEVQGRRGEERRCRGGEEMEGREEVTLHNGEGVEQNEVISILS